MFSVHHTLITIDIGIDIAIDINGDI